MDVADLLPLSGDRGRVTCRTLTLAVGPGLAGQNALARQGLVAERLLTAVRETELHWDVADNAAGRTVVTADNPFLDEHVRAKLDPTGVLPEGSVLEPGDVIFSAYRLTQDLLRRREPPPGMRWALPCSGNVPPGWEGATLTSVSRRPAAAGVAERIEATLRAEDDLAAGDALLLEHALVAVVDGFVPDGEMPDADGTRPDLLVSPAVGDRLSLRPG